MARYRLSNQDPLDGENRFVPWRIPMSSREVADAFVESLKAIIDEDRIRMYPVSFDANLYDAVDQFLGVEQRAMHRRRRVIDPYRLPAGLQAIEEEGGHVTITRRGAVAAPLLH
jgi:hypothetical protein